MSKGGTNKDKIMFILRTSKTHGKGSPPQTVKLSSQRTGTNEVPIYCPFAAIENYVAIRKTVAKEDEQFFVFKDRSPVTASCFRNVITTIIEAIGLNPNLYSSHSFRSGRMTDMMDMNIPFETIK